MYDAFVQDLANARVYHMSIFRIVAGMHRQKCTIAFARMHRLELSTRPQSMAHVVPSRPSLSLGAVEAPSSL